MEVYIELVYLINLLIIIVSYQILTIILNINLDYKRLLLYSLLTNISLIVLYIDASNYILLVSWLIVFSILFKKQVFLFYPSFLFIYFSLIRCISSLVQESYIYSGILIIPISYTNLSIMIISILFVILQFMFVIYCRHKIKINEYLLDVSINYKNKKIDCVGFLDSGNEVYYEGYPIILLNKQLVVEYEVIDVVSIDNIKECYIEIIIVDKLVVNKQILKNVYVGIIENIKYDCLLNKQLMGGIL